MVVMLTGMQTAKPAVLLTLAVAIFTAEACKTDDETVVVADAEAPPPAEVDAAPPTEPTPAATTPPIPVPTTPVTTPTTPRDAGVTDAGKTDAGTATADAGKTDAGTVKPGGNFQACAQKCQAVLASCLTPQAGKDGGLPTFGDATKCKAASDACQAACK
jgi:hypothetical protein